MNKVCVSFSSLYDNHRRHRHHHHFLHFTFLDNNENGGGMAVIYLDIHVLWRAIYEIEYFSCIWRKCCARTLLRSGSFRHFPLTKPDPWPTPWKFHQPPFPFAIGNKNDNKCKRTRKLYFYIWYKDTSMSIADHDDKVKSRVQYNLK